MHRKKPQSSTVFRLIFMGLLLCVSFSAGCAEKIQTVVLAPPENLLEQCQPPIMPPELMQTSDIEVYSRAATSALARYGESFGKCAGKLEALRTWRKQATSTER